MKDSNNIEERNDDQSLCLACLGGKVVFNGIEYEDCTTCNSTGFATEDENDGFLYSEINQN